MQKNIDQQIKIEGEITGRFYDQSILSQSDRLFNRIIEKLRSTYPEIMKLYKLGRLVREDYHKNVICNAGFAKLTHVLGDNNTHNCYINKMALGTGAGTPTASDIKLATEAYRNDTASGTDVSNVLYLTAYFTEVECNGTYTEFGNFIGGTGSANSGSIWSHIAGLNWVKSSTIALVVSCKYTFASA